MTIEIVLDPYKIHEEGTSFIVQNEDDYVKARFHIREAIEKDADVELVVKNRGINEWFKDLDSFAIFKNISPVEILKSLLNCSDLPKIFVHLPQKIVDFDLIRLAHEKPIRHGQSSLDWILEATISFPWIRKEIKESGDIVQIIEWLVKNRNTPIDTSLLQLCIEKIKVWKNNSPFKILLEWLETNPFERSYLFCLCQILRNYPESQKARWLQYDNLWSQFCQLPDRSGWVNEIPSVCKIDISPTLGIKIKEYIQKRLGKQGLTKEFIKELSGVLKVEKEVIQRYLLNPNTDKTQFTVEIINELQAEYGESDLNDLLSKLKPVDAPPDISNDANIADIVVWLQKYYFPYRIWCRTADKEDLLKKPIGQFEAWIIKNYDILLSNQPEIFVCGVRKVIHSLIQEGSPVLLIIIDGFAWQWADCITNGFKNKGLFLEREQEVRFSMIPSISEISKPCIIKGLDLSDIRKPQPLSIDYYNQLFKESYSKYVGERVIATDSTDILINLLQEDSKVYLYLFNRIDEIAHGTNNDELRDDKIKHAIEGLMLDINCAVQRFESMGESKLKVVITGDHGYLPPSELFEQITVDDSLSCSHGRVVFNSEIEDCYLLKLYGEIYSIAKGFHFIGKRPRGCVHGGITPDEITVPFLIFSTTSPEILKPCVTFDGQIKRRFRECSFSIEITNPNAYKLSVLELEIDYIKVLDTLPLEIPPNSTKELKGILDASHIDESEVKLEYRLKSACLGQENIVSTSILLKTTGAALTDKTFEEEFDV